MYEVPRAAITKHHILGGLQQQKRILSQARSQKLKRCEGWFLLESLRENPFQAPPSFWWWLTILGVAGLVDTPSLCPSSHSLLSAPPCLHLLLEE